MRDPRGHRRYVESAAAYVNARRGTAQQCALCGQPIDTGLPSTHPRGPTVEHRVKVRDIVAMAGTWDEAVAMCCDQSAWSLAHRRCQNRQGAAMVNRTAESAPTSREW